MIQVSFETEKKLLSIVYEGVVSLNDLHGIVDFAVSGKDALPKNITVLFDIRNGTYDFEIGEIANISIEFDKVISNFDSVRVIALRSKNNDPLYTDFFHMLSKQPNVEFYVFDEDESGARACIEDREVKLRAGINVG